jgi:hypothetical protein
LRVHAYNDCKLMTLHMIVIDIFYIFWIEIC